MTYSKRILTARQKLKLSQAKAARQWGFSLSTLQKWEQEDRHPAGLYREKLEAILRKIEDND